MKTQKERLLYFIKDHLGISVRAFERHIGTSQATIPQIKEKISATLLEKICAAYPQLNRYWLLTGEGSMTIVDKPEEQNIYFNTGTAIQGSAGSTINTGDSDELDALRARVRELESVCDDLRKELHEREIRIARLEGMIEILKS